LIRIDRIFIIFVVLGCPTDLLSQVIVPGIARYCTSGILIDMCVDHFRIALCVPTALTRRSVLINRGDLGHDCYRPARTRLADDRTVCGFYDIEHLAKR
jgi:hypothetical protein